MTDQQSPDPTAVRALRESVQASRDLGITAAQDYCAERMMVKRRAWQYWESGKRQMHPAMWAYSKIRIKP